MPADQEQRLRQLAATARQQGVRLRFWDAPDNPNTWAQLVDAGAEVNTNDPVGFRRWYERWKAGR